ncbi:DUF4255 domain-containing protein [Leptobacterium flavescens]|uniref:DUF4255 domain-containing protein n=1 Tax=Leptobacterium flavescens TaxID=472055 RepID=A0A6P0UJK3_9FLAO|nr:DUF4255 domain-containing protein [Leptobacterium flavescens]NER12049.1 DUF4255 domain-containing protein [Leptobacterium flavescens]
MIGSALKLLRDELSNYVFQNKRPTDAITEDDIILHNIALMDGETHGDLNNKIIITLVNTEEESTLKNNSNTIRTLNGTRYVEPPVFLNLYILISTTLGQDLQDAYEFALHRLSLVIQFFQAKKSFTVKNSPFTTVSGDITISQEEKDELRLNVELYTLTFEQINHLWGSLGGKQVPFAMYKVRLVKIQENTEEDAPVIETIERIENMINADCDE